MTACQLTDEERRGHGVDGELLPPGMRSYRGQHATEPVSLTRRERVLHPASGVVDEYVNRSKLFFGGVEQGPRRLRLAQVGLDRDGQAAIGFDLGDHRSGVLAAMLPVRLWPSRVSWFLETQVCAQDPHS